ncbi:MAG: ABC transporter ATP-binding protein [Planctomycetaceae bacterium]
MIEVRSLRKSFQSLNAVDDLSFQVRKQETFGLLGPNGAGKTTTIGMITGVIKPDSGSIAIDGIDDPSVAESRRAIGIAPQELSLYDNLTADENLTFFARLYGMSSGRLRERVDWALEFAGLTDRRRGRVHTFSGGMQRRLNLAAALVHDPQVILLDEPTVGVDPQSRNHIFESIEQLKAEGRTIVYTTHYMEEAQRLCDRVAIMDHGKILDLDTIDALIDRHGGRSVVKAQLQRAPEDGLKLPATLDGLSLRFETEQPLKEIGRLSSSGVAFHTLEVARPDLETVFLTLTGRSLRD